MIEICMQRMICPVLSPTEWMDAVSLANGIIDFRESMHAFQR